MPPKPNEEARRVNISGDYHDDDLYAVVYSNGAMSIGYDPDDKEEGLWLDSAQMFALTTFLDKFIDKDQNA